jgi:large subunit ribosomal protein L22
MKAILKTVRITPKKANLIAGMVRQKPVNEALEILKYTPKKAAKIIHKLLSSAVSNAVNNFKQDQKSLIVKEIIINKGPTLKRGVPVSRGRVYPILKRTAHIVLTLEINQLDLDKKSDKSSKKSESKVESTEKKTTKVKKSTKKSS